VETAYDWITVAIFAGLIVLFMQRSTTEDDSVHDPIWMYLTASVGCALANFLGNDGLHVLAIIAIVATLAFIVHFLKPFSSNKPS
jgi:Ca2+/Na+ antiporter